MIPHQLISFIVVRVHRSFLLDYNEANSVRSGRTFPLWSPLRSSLDLIKTHKMGSADPERPVEEHNPPSASSSFRPPHPSTPSNSIPRARSHRAATPDPHCTRSPPPSPKRLSPEISRSRTARTTSTLSEDPEVLRPPQPPSPAPPGPNAPPPSEEVTPLRFAAHYGGLVLASMIGTLIRLGLEALATCEWFRAGREVIVDDLVSDDGQVIFALAWAQGVGCGIMGLSLARKNDVVAVWVFAPLDMTEKG